MFGSKTEEIAALTASLNEAKENNESLAADLANARQVAADAEVSAAEARTQLAAAQEKISALEADLQTAQSAADPERIEKIASAKAAEFAAGLNLPPDAAPAGSGENADDPQDGAGLYARYRELAASNPAAASKFWAKHETAITSAAGR